MKISPTTKMPRISDRDLMLWYNLKDKEDVREFKKESGYKFMIAETEKIEFEPLKEYMKLVFSQKKHLELFLAETKNMDWAFELFIAPFTFIATEMVKGMPQQYHEYASWYTDKQLKLSNWLERKTMDEMISHMGAFQENN